MNRIWQNFLISSSNCYGFRRPLNVQLNKLRSLSVGTALVALVLIGIVTFEIILLFWDPALPPEEGAYYSVDYGGEVLTEEDEYRQVFSLMDSIPDGFVTLQEFEAFALHRFKTHESSLLNEETLDESSIENEVIQDSFLRTLDMNHDGILTDDELTTENVKALFDKAKEVMTAYDKDGNGLVTWKEFYE